LGQIQKEEREPNQNFRTSPEKMTLTQQALNACSRGESKTDNCVEKEKGIWREEETW